MIPVAKAAEEADHYTEIESPESPDSEPPKAKLPNPVWVVIGAGVLIFTIVGMMKSLNNLLRDINHLDAIVILLAVIAGVLFSINKSLANSKDRNDKSPPAD